MKGDIKLSKKQEKGYSQKGKPNSDTVNPKIAAEELDKAIHPTNTNPSNS